MNDQQIKALDQCARAVSAALYACSREKAPDPAEVDLTDPAYRLCVEATCLLEAIAELRGKPSPRLRYA